MNKTDNKITYKLIVGNGETVLEIELQEIQSKILNTTNYE